MEDKQAKYKFWLHCAT